MHELSQRFMFEAAHTLRRALETESSGRVHGHTYFAEVTISGVPDRESGMVVDLTILRERIEAVRKELDHQLLDNVTGLGHPTLENLCSYIARRLQPSIPSISAVRVWREGSGDACRLTMAASERLTGSSQQ